MMTMMIMMMRCMTLNTMIESTTKQIWQGLEYSLEFSLSCHPSTSQHQKPSTEKTAMTNQTPFKTYHINKVIHPQPL